MCRQCRRLGSNAVDVYSTPNNNFGWEAGTGDRRIGDNDSTLFFGDIAEILIFNRVLSTDQRLAVETYFNNKYNVIPSTVLTPTNLTATAISGNQVILNWDLLPTSVNPYVNYVVQRKTGTNGVYASIAVLSDQNSYVDNQLTGGTSCVYRLQAQNEATNFPAVSGFSSEVSVTTFTGVQNVPVTNLVLWLSADTLAGSSNGAPVALWRDHSGWNDHGVQTNVNNQPTWLNGAVNGRPAVTFAGSQSLLLTNFVNVVASSGQAEVYVVLSAPTNYPATPGAAWQFGASPNPDFYPNSDGTISDDFGSLNGYKFVPPISLSQYHLYNASVANNQWNARLNGFMAYSSAANTYGWSASPELGNLTNSFGGNIAEVLVFNRTLTVDERDAVAGYLDQKYAFVTFTNLPSHLVATALSAGQISLKWAGAQGAASTVYQVERKTGSGGTYSVIASLRDQYSYLDTGVTPGTQYYYRVSATTFSGKAGYSNEANATTLNNGALIPVTNLVVWLRADYGTATNSDGSINFWQDQSGNNNNASQGSLANCPAFATNSLNGLPAVHFDGVSSYFYLPAALNPRTAAEVFLVVRAASAMPSQTQGLWHFGGSTQSGWDEYPGADGALADDFGSQMWHYLGVPTQPITQFSVYELSAQTNAWFAWLNGALLYQTNGNNYAFGGPYTLGYSQDHFGNPGNQFFFGGDMAEMLMFNRPLTSVERDAVGAYLNQRYNLVTNPPATPSYLRADAVSSSQTVVTWNPGIASQYLLERKTGTNGTYAQIAALHDTLEWIDSGLLPQSQYVYRLRLANYAGDSAYASEVTVTTPASETNMPVSQLLLWLKADAQSWTNGTAMATWPDISGDRNDAVQGVDANQPLLHTNVANGKPAIYFNGNAFFTLPPSLYKSATQAEVFIVVKSDQLSFPTSQGLMASGCNDGSIGTSSYPAPDGSISDDFGSTATTSLGIPLQPINQFHLFNVQADAGWVARINGTTLAALTGNQFCGAAAPLLGESASQSTFSGHVAEMIIFRRTLSLAERGTVENYLNQRYSMVPVPPPAPPLTISSSSTNYVTLVWPSVTNATGFLVERAPWPNGVFSVIATLPYGTETSFTDANVSVGIPYVYCLQAVSIAGISSPSNQVQLSLAGNTSIFTDALYDYFIGIDPTAGGGGDNSQIALKLFTPLK